MYKKWGLQRGLTVASVFLLIAVMAMTAAAQSLESITYNNPIDIGIADPCVIRASDGRFYLYSTGLSVWSSDDLVNWKREGSVKPANTWGVADFWAPEVIEYEGKFYLFYSAERPQGGKRVALAISDSPTGPFEDLGHPLFDFGYSAIDASPFIDDDGRKYLFYSKDQVGIGGGRYESSIYGVELSDDFTSVVGEPVLLIKPDQAWELLSGNRLWNEGGYVVKHNGKYYLMYSANYYGGVHYSVGYAVSEHPLGPYVKYANNPVLSRGPWVGELSGTGHHSVVRSPDGTELFIVYHVHADPAVGGGNRRLAIDRMGFRQDGSIYVSGPTLTPQPKPSGTTPLVNLAAEAVVTASSVRVPYRVDALKDGEIVTQIKNAQYDWASNDGEGTWVRFQWPTPRRIKYLFLYGSVMGTRIEQATVSYGTGDEVAGQVTTEMFPLEPGVAVVVTLPDNEDISWIEISIDKLVNPAGTAALSEVMVLGYPAGMVWISSFNEGDTLTEVTPVSVEAPGIPVKWVQIAMNEEIWYEDDVLPTGLILDPAQLERGYYRLSVSLVDQHDTEYQYDTGFQVEHARLVTPDPGARLSGEVLLEVAPVIPDQELAQVEIVVERFVADEKLIVLDTTGVDRISFQTTSLPWSGALNTLALEDGAYDIAIHATTVHGVRSERRERVVVSNWTVLEDHLLPPKNLGLFGILESLKTSDKSKGWAYTDVNPELFSGDRDRMLRSSNTDEYLTWNLSNLYRGILTVYSKYPEIEGSVRVEASPDGNDWYPVICETEIIRPGTEDNPWWELKVIATVPTDLKAEFLRVVFTAQGLPKDELQLGYVRLVGLQDAVNVPLIVD